MSSRTKESGGLADRYAIALFELAEENKLLDAVAADLESLDAMIAASADLRRLIRSPAISRDEQQRAMTALAEQAEMNELTERFLGLLAHNRRLFALPAVITAYREILAGRRGETAAEVISASKLSEKQLKAVAAALKQAIGAKVVIAERLDPGLLGGLVVKVGSRMVDSSLRTKLQRLRLAMKGVG